MTYTAIPDANIASGKPIREVDGLLLRDNPIAMMNGSSGAPRLRDGALYSGAATSERNSWVRNGIALSVIGATGTYALLKSSVFLNIGATTAGSNLEYANTEDGSLNSPVGTWRLMGFVGSSGDTSDQRTSLFLRIS